MGSIQSLRSWALATRANEDTDLQTSGFLGGVNKSLGSQIVGLIDQLQGVIGERTKAYNQLVSSINRTIDGKDGVAPKAINAAFSGMNLIFSGIAAVYSLVNGRTGLDDFTPAGIISTVGSLVSNILTGLGVKKTVDSAVYDYEKMMSQLGYMQSTGTDYTGVGGGINVTSVNLTTGASKFLDIRDSLMPKFNRYDPIGGSVQYIPYNLRGSVGSLRRS